MPLQEDQIPDWAKKQLAGQVGPNAVQQPIAKAQPGAYIPNPSNPWDAPSQVIPAWASKQIHANQLFLGGDDAKLAMFTDIKAEDAPGIWERGARGIAMGVSQAIPASLSIAGGILDFMGAEELGQQAVDTGITIDQWLQEHVAVENPKFLDHLFSGIGSMVYFAGGGIGVAGVAAKAAKGLGLAGKAAKFFQVATQAGTMAFLESAIEQSQRQNELMAQGMSPSEALAASQDVFWQNMIMLTATNAPFFSPARRVAKAAMGFFSEGGQERYQEVVQAVANGTGQWSDYFDPSKHGTATMVGAIIGSGAGALMPGESKAPPDEKPRTVEPPLAPTPAEQEIPGNPPTEPPLPGPYKPDGQSPYGEAYPPSGPVAQAVGRLEGGLSDHFGVEIHLADRLTPDQLEEIAGMALEVEETVDNKEAWRLEDATWNKALEYLLRDPSIVPTGKRGERQLEGERSDKANSQVAQAEATMGKPDIGGMVKQAPTQEDLDRQAKEKVVLDAREQKKNDYRAQKGAAKAEKQAMKGFPGIGPLPGQKSAKSQEIVSKPTVETKPVTEEVSQESGDSRGLPPPIETIKEKAKQAASPKVDIKESAKVKAAGGRWTVYNVPMDQIVTNEKDMQR